ncbi:MAG: GTPase HflX [Deltaproteobacteria bacterium]|nr:GTPase HflX [Deltaproteobacteria bacterium]
MAGDETQTGVLVAVQLAGVPDDEFESSLGELARLAKTLGVRVVGRVTQRRSSLAASAVLGAGKLHELARWTGGTGVVPVGPPKRRGKGGEDEPEEELGEGVSGDLDEDLEGAEVDERGGQPSDDAGSPAPTERANVVILDHDVSPSQARNLERATGVEVLDRTAVILAIFRRHARSREAALEVEIARLTYQAPRVRESGVGKDRQAGGIGGKGAGEAYIELDRRRIRDRIAELRGELAAIELQSQHRRSRRSHQATVALVGYTNAGKSSWMRLLTGSGVLVEDKLFATLDTTVRALHPETRPRILVSDTVGFIKKLPHSLVASFRSTLAEAREASLLVHVVDASDPAFRQHMEVTRRVLRELDAGDSPELLLLNKADRVDEPQRAALVEEFPDAVILSAKRSGDVARLRDRVLEFFEREMVDGDVFVPYTKGRWVSEVHARCRVLAESYEADGTRMTVRTHAAELERLRAAVDE